MIDLETQSVANLKHGLKAYLRHPSTRLLSLVASHGNFVLVWAPAGRWPGKKLEINPHDLWPAGIPKSASVMLDSGDACPAVLRKWLDSGYTFAAHNAAGFDAAAFRDLVSSRYSCSEPSAWYDTLPACRAAGLPGKLDDLGHIFLGTGKDEGGAVLKLMYTVKVRNGQPVYPVGTLPVWKQLLRYNVKDVLLLHRVFTQTLGSGEPDVLDAHSAVNSRGIAFDLGFLSRLQDLWTDAENSAMDEIAALTGGALTGDNLRSVPQVKAWLKAQGVHTDTLNRQALERLYEYPEEFFGECDDLTERHAFVCEVLKLRQTVTRVSKAKLQRIAEMADPDNRVRDVLVYCGAHTGRWSGKGIQPHNMARGVGDLDTEGLLLRHAGGRLDIEQVKEAAAKCKGHPRTDDVLSTLLRPVFCAGDGNTLLIADYAAIEGRGVGWVAEEVKLLDAFRSGTDIYCQMASAIFGRPITKADKMERQIGKITVLGCGYSMSAAKFAAFCKACRVVLEDAGTDAEACVTAYRDQYPAIAGRLEGKFRKGGIWQKYNDAVRMVLKGKPSRFEGKCVFGMNGPDLQVWLPSGRRLTYRNARIEPRVPPYADALGLAMEPKPTVVYDHNHWGPGGGTLYGGLITENIVQAICRDLLAAALVRCEYAGLSPVLHVHDEIVCEVPAGEAKARMEELVTIMSEPPAWADGFPISVEGFSCPRYSKSPFRGSWEVAGANGRITSVKCKDVSGGSGYLETALSAFSMPGPGSPA
jgi:DNA polymerase